MSASKRTSARAQCAIPGGRSVDLVVRLAELAGKALEAGDRTSAELLVAAIYAVGEKWGAAGVAGGSARGAGQPRGARSVLREASAGRARQAAAPSPLPVPLTLRGPRPTKATVQETGTTV